MSGILITPTRFVAGPLDSNNRYIRVTSSPTTYLPFGPHVDLLDNGSYKAQIGPYSTSSYNYAGTFTGPPYAGVSK